MKQDKFNMLMQHFVGRILTFRFTPGEIATVWRKRNVFSRNVTPASEPVSS